jgi:hypothetical protein
MLEAVEEDEDESNNTDSTLQASVAKHEAS